MTGAQELVDSFYGRFASLYDAVATAPVVGGWRERCAAELALSPGDTVVEMGCGTGANLPYLREQVGPGGTVIAVDVVPAMLDRARERAGRRGWENVRVVRGDATRPPVETVDAAVATFVTGMLADPAEAVRTWVQRVRPGGRVALMNAVRTDRPVCQPLNLGFRAFARLAAPGGRLERPSPARRLERRWTEAVDALFADTVDHSESRFGLGFVVLASGRVPTGAAG